jgi:uncharacterized repeat protein (TIGR03803 family)
MSRLDRFWKTAVAVFFVCAVAPIALPAQTLTTLFSFDGTDGAYPSWTSLVQATDGNLYGTTANGGTGYGGGTIFKITPDGTLTTLLSFCGLGGCRDGDEPFDLIQATDGNFYGVTYYGGPNNSSVCHLGCGTVFKFTPDGTLTTLYNFCSQANCADGALPGSLTEGTDGNFYGSTGAGGAGQCLAAGNGLCGTIFKITPDGTLTTLYNFCSQSNCADGSSPGSLLQATDGNFYGVTALGGASAALGGAGSGTTFRITPNGILTVIYNFCSQPGCTDGADPAGLIEGTDGYFYGATTFGGQNGSSYGTVFKLTRGGTLTTLHSFCGRLNCPDGWLPYRGVIQATDGDLYGTTLYGGANPGNCDRVGCGVMYRVTRNGAYSRVYSFCSQEGCTDGSHPVAAPIQDTNGTLYGTAAAGGTTSACPREGCGTVFSLSEGMGPFVATRPTSGQIGAVINILGTDLTGATSVTFNGVTAAFSVASSSLITATVPVGATSGTVQVVTQAGTLSSNAKFRVRP